jgi:uncharacterized RmlC-like cupin family protein
MGTFKVSGKYDKYFFDPPSVLIKEDNVQSIYNSIFMQGARPISSLTLNYHFVNKPYVSKSSPHTHNYHEFLVWYGCNINGSEDFGAEIVLYLGEDLEKHVITKPTFVSLPPGFSHCPLEITKVDKPIFQVTMALEV